MCSKFVNYSRLDNQHNWGDVYDQSIRKDNSHSDINMSFKNYEENGYDLNLNLLT